MLKGRLLKQEPLSKYTSWRVGGIADQMYFPKNREDLLNFLKSLAIDEPLFWLGLGSNLLVRDAGFRGTVINTRGNLREMYQTDTGHIYVEAGVACAHVAKFCCEHGLAGAEFLAGIPGTMGGALAMNAGAFGGETWQIVEIVEMVTRQGQVLNADKNHFEIGYRHVIRPDNQWFLATQLKLSKTNDTSVGQQQIKQLLAQRSKTQPTNQPTCGSVFKNPEHDYAARLIEVSGLKGYRIGGACVSEKHANFIINTGKATATDIEKLINYVRDEVEKQQGQRLQPEVCMVGNK